MTRVLAVALALTGCGASQRSVEPEHVVVVPHDAGTDAFVAIDAASIPPEAIDAAVIATPEPTVTPTDDTLALVRRGRRVYVRACETCHEDGPRLVGRHLDAARVRFRVRRGGRRMPAIPVSRLGDEDLAALCAFLAAP